MGYGGWEKFPARPAKPVSGGIRSQSQGKRAQASWWAKRWISVLEGFGLGSRLSRGRSYARNGRVTELSLSSEGVCASVQGSSSTPYQVSIRMKAFGEAEWEKVSRELQGSPYFRAKLLSGQMPVEIEEVFSKAGVSFFPERLKDLATSCSCPDFSNPCKHIAAVYYLIGEEFDRDPFLLFVLRGKSSGEFFGMVSPESKSEESSLSDPSSVEEDSSGSEGGIVFPTDPVLFWGRGGVLPDVPPIGERPVIPASLPKRLGAFPFWRGTSPLIETLAQQYNGTYPVAVEFLSGQNGSDPDDSSDQKG